MKRIDAMLRRHIGLDSATVGSALIERAIRLRMKKRGATSAERYGQLLHESREEWDELVESVVITETWFFRDREPFAALVNLLQREWLPQNPTKILRLLSLPCSTGEEPYSLAMALIDAGLARNRFAIDAVDLSARALERARHAVYGKNSFRGKALEFRPRHFTENPSGGTYTLRREIRECVQFQRGNLLDAAWRDGARRDYDFIFCRNLLIYFDRPTQSRAFEHLRGLLAPRGVLFVAPAEMSLIADHGFVSASLPMAFACRTKNGKDAIGCSKAERAGKVDGGEWRAEKPNQSAITPRPPETEKLLAHRFADPSSEVSAELLRVRELADGGKLEEAAALCESYLRSHGQLLRAAPEGKTTAGAWIGRQELAEGFYLLGLISEARSQGAEHEGAARMERPDQPSAVNHQPSAIRDFAEACYRKALYLEPNHYETLLQLALLLERNGGTEEARTLKRRAQRRAGPSRPVERNKA